MTSRILAALAALLVSAGSAEAGVLTYSGYLLDPQGKPVTTSTTLQFRFYPGSAGGAVIWEDVVVVAPGADGWFSAVLGANASNPLDAADFAQQLWLAIKVSTDAQEMSPRMRIGTAPYALTVPWDGVQGKPTSFPVDPALVQARVTGTCGAGQFMTGVGETGTVTCGTDSSGTGDVTGVTAGAGLTGGGAAGDVTLAVDTAAMQVRVAATCPAGTAIRAIDAAGGVTCETDDSATYAAGSGLALAGTTFSTDNAVVARKDGTAGNQTFDAGTLHLDYTNNRVGVGTVAPAVPLHVNGAVRATSYTLGTPLTGKFFIAGNSMTPNLDFQDEEWGISGSGYGYIAGGVAGYALPLSGAVNIPNGATLTSLFCQYYDNDTLNGLGLSASLYRRAFSAATAELLGSLSASTTAAGVSTAVLTVSDVTIATPIIDSANYHYYFYVTFSNTPGFTSNLRLYGCGVQYSYSSLTD